MQPSELRPFHFIVVVWGERYVDFLCNFCIPALLSPGNIPALENRGNKFLIATTDEDWERMRSRPIFERLARYVEPVKVQIPPCPPDVSGCVHMGVGHKLATQMAYEERAYSVLLTPDLMVSDGTMAAVQRHAAEGVQVVLCAALRFGEEPLFEHLEKLGVVSAKARLGDSGEPLVASARKLVAAGVQSFHSETLRYDWEAPHFSGFPAACWWRVPGADGILVHSLSWAPLLVDYGAVKHHDSSMMDHWTIDGDYVFRNFGLGGKVHVVQDSDETMLVSWAPMADREQSLKPRLAYRLFGDWMKGLVLYETASGPVFDPLKREIFRRPVAWHSRDLDETWKSKQAEARDVLAHYFPTPEEAPRTLVATLHRGLVVVLGYGLRLLRIAHYYWTGRERILGVLVRAVRGDESARQRIKRNFRFFQQQLGR